MRLKLPAKPARRNHERRWLLNYHKSNDNRTEWERSPAGELAREIVRQMMVRQIELWRDIKAIEASGQ